MRLFDDKTFETLAKYPLEPNENDTSIISCSFDGDDIYFVVGTAFVDPHSEPESSRGRILVFKVSNTSSVVVETLLSTGMTTATASFRVLVRASKESHARL